MTAREMFEKLGFELFLTNGQDSLYVGEDEKGKLHIGFFETTKDIAFEYTAKSGANQESSLLSAIHKQCEELGWLEEEKRESNLEHYKDKIKYAGYEFSLVNGKLTSCRLTLCDQCYFNDKHFTCARKRMEWMLKPYKKSVYKLTKFEYDLLNAYKNSGMRQCISNYSTLLELYEKGHIKDIDTSTPIYEILDNCEVIKDENC